MASEYERLADSVALCCDCSLTEARAAVALIVEAMLAKCGAIALEEIKEADDDSEFGSGYREASIRIADDIAALKGSGEGL